VEEQLKEQQREKTKKKVYTPFPPPQLPRKVKHRLSISLCYMLRLLKMDLQMESGEYFLKPKEREAKQIALRKRRVIAFLTSILVG
jgi:ribosomal RNA assembly protein